MVEQDYLAELQALYDASERGDKWLLSIDQINDYKIKLANVELSPPLADFISKSKVAFDEITLQDDKIQQEFENALEEAKIERDNAVEREVKLGSLARELEKAKARLQQDKDSIANELNIEREERESERRFLREQKHGSRQFEVVKQSSWILFCIIISPVVIIISLLALDRTSEYIGTFADIFENALFVAVGIYSSPMMKFFGAESDSISSAKKPIKEPPKEPQK